jgi:hypothetical protein
MSLNQVFLSGRIDRRPRVVLRDNGEKAYSFIMAVRNGKNGLIYPALICPDRLPPFAVNWDGDGGLRSQPVITVSGTLNTRNYFEDRDFLTRRMRKAGLPPEVIARIVDLLPEDFRMPRVAVEILVQPDQIVPGGPW